MGGHASLKSQEARPATSQPGTDAGAGGNQKESDATERRRAFDSARKYLGEKGRYEGAWQARDVVSLSPTVSLNVRTTFKGIGGFVGPDVGAATGGVDHNYEDGYNRVDGRGVGDGRTWNWGYSNAGQTPGNNTVVMNSSSSPGDFSARAGGGDYKAGFELRYLRGVGHKENLRWGIESSLSWNEVSARDSSAFTGTEIRVTDTYSLNGIIPPPAGFAGNAVGPGPLISDVPARVTTVTPGAVSITGERRLNASVLALRVGPNVEWRPGAESRWGLALNTGITMAVVDSQFSFNETVTIPTIGPLLQPGLATTQTRAASGHTTGVLFGGYLGLAVTYQLTERLSLVGGGQYQNVGTFAHVVAGKQAEIELGNTIQLTLGLRYSF